MQVTLGGARRGYHGAPPPLFFGFCAEVGQTRAEAARARARARIFFLPPVPKRPLGAPYGNFPHAAHIDGTKN
jgi:hypothetical protein